jgi:hypothetical protein
MISQSPKQCKKNRKLSPKVQKQKFKILKKIIEKERLHDKKKY